MTSRLRGAHGTYAAWSAWRLSCVESMASKLRGVHDIYAAWSAWRLRCVNVMRAAQVWRHLDDEITEEAKCLRNFAESKTVLKVVLRTASLLSGGKKECTFVKLLWINHRANGGAFLLHQTAKRAFLFYYYVSFFISRRFSLLLGFVTY